MPRTLPVTECMLVVRTDFSDQGAWEAVRAAIGEPGEDGYLEDYMYGVEFVDDVGYRDISGEELLRLIPEGYDASILAVVDETTIRSPEMPLVLVDLNELNEEYGRAMRVIPAELPSIEVNLHIGNMDFFEFADNADEDGVFRGFPE
ncbi:DUF6924 domain-containing protein [Actinoallomurus vinaceus]|uniref:DUF6924 domain-containing protein n=1 Tax=Actinoallomurus vinaceus TaxID=1080074 RepID=UPI0031E4F5D4